MFVSVTALLDQICMIKKATKLEVEIKQVFSH